MYTMTVFNQHLINFSYLSPKKHAMYEKSDFTLLVIDYLLKVIRRKNDFVLGVCEPITVINNLLKEMEH